MKLDELDIKILRALSQNAKTPFLEIARMCNVSGAAIHQHIQALTANGVIKGSEFLLDATKVGLPTCAFIFVKLSGCDTAAFVKKIEAIDAIVECDITSGESDALLKAYTKDNAGLAALKEAICGIDGVQITNTVLSLSEPLKRQIKI